MFSGKGKQHRKVPTKTFKKDKKSDTAKPVLVCGIKRHSFFLLAWWLLCRSLFIYSSEVTLLSTLLQKWACPWMEKKSAHKPHLRWSRFTMSKESKVCVCPCGPVCVHSGALSSGSIYVWVFGWQRGLEFDLSLSFLPLQAENLKVQLSNRMEYITTQSVLSNEVNTTLFCSSLSWKWTFFKHYIIGLCEASTLLKKKKKCNFYGPIPVAVVAKILP